VMPSNNVLLYRSYLYTTAATTANVIRFQGNHYIKFPRAYAVLRHRDGTVHAGIANPYYDTHYYATCFDCRTYSHTQKELMRKPDSATTIGILRRYRQANQLAFKVHDTKMPWPSTAHDDVDACKYICPEYQARPVDAWIPHTLPDVTTHDQEYMFTLPDVFKPLPEGSSRDGESELDEDSQLDADSELDAVQRRCIHTIKSELEQDVYNTMEKRWSDEKFWPSFDNPDFDAVREYNKLRNSSKYIGTRFTADCKVKHALKLHMPLDEPLKTIIAGIRRRIGARPNEDSP
jgi:hypothetical protein